MTIGEFSVVISVAGIIPYVVGIVRGNVRPERTTWFVWSLILALSIWGYHSMGADDSVLFLVGDLIATGIVFLLSLWRGIGGWTRLDISCLVIALLGLLLWQTSAVPSYGVCGALIADAVALVPTILKALHSPDSETPVTYAFSSLAAACGIVAVGSCDIQLLVYPVYLFFANFTTALIVWVGQYHLRQHIVLGRA